MPAPESRDERLKAAIDRIPALAVFAPDEVHAAPLDSLTNQVYRLDTPGGCFVLRLPGPGANVDRTAELHHHRLAAAVGLAPEVVFGDPEDGTLLTMHVAGAHALAARDLARPGARNRVVRALRALHTSGAPFVGRLSLAAALADYRRRVTELGVALPAGAEVDLDRVTAAAEKLADLPEPVVPSHNDPSPPNLLDTGRRVLLIDWEYAGLAEPTWDLATVATEAALDADGAWDLQVAYLERAPTHAEAGRLFVYMAGLDVLGGLWGLVQAESGNAATDFGAYAERRLQRAARWSASGALDHALAAVTSARGRRRRPVSDGSPGSGH